jgi:hypothetical protein
MARWQQRATWVMLVGAGFLAGAATAFLQPKGILLFLALFVWLWTQRRSRPNFRTADAMFLSSGYLGFIAGFVLYFRSKGALSAIIYNNFLWPATNYSRVNSLRYGHGLLLYYWDHWISARHQFPWTVALGVIFMVPLIWVAALPIIVAPLAVYFRRFTLQPISLLLWLCGVAIWASELHRKDMTHLVSGSPVLMILCVMYLEKINTQTLEYALQVLLISASCLALFDFFVITTACTEQTRVGRVKLLTPDRVLPYLLQHVPRGEEMIVFPYHPSYYFLTGTTNPTRYSIMTHNYNTPSQFADVLSVLKDRKTKYVVWDKDFDLHGEIIFPTSSQVSKTDLIVEDYLRSHYDVTYEDRGVLVMKLRETHPDNPHR